MKTITLNTYEERALLKAVKRQIEHLEELEPQVETKAGKKALRAELRCLAFVRTSLERK